MTVYEFAVYEMLPAAVLGFAAGMIYRIARYLSVYKRTVRPRRRARSIGHSLVHLVKTFAYPIYFSIKEEKIMFASGLLGLHILGVIPLLFLFSHHVTWWAYYFPPYAALKRLAIPPSATSAALTVTAPVTPVSGMSGTFVNTIWGRLTVVLNGDVLAIIAIVATAFKVVEKIPKKFVGKVSYVRIGDFVALLLLLFILVTGFMATQHLPSGEIGVYKTVLGLHIMGAEVLLILLPFTKFFHFVFGYWYGKLHEWYDLVWTRGV